MFDFRLFSLLNIKNSNEIVDKSKCTFINGLFLINSSLLNDGKAKFKSGLQSLGSQPVLKRLEELYRSIQK